MNLTDVMMEQLKSDLSNSHKLTFLLFYSLYDIISTIHSLVFLNLAIINCG